MGDNNVLAERLENLIGWVRGGFKDTKDLVRKQNSRIYSNEKSIAVLSHEVRDVLSMVKDHRENIKTLQDGIAQKRREDMNSLKKWIFWITTFAITTTVSAVAFLYRAIISM